jgi:hypothetical protein
MMADSVKREVDSDIDSQEEIPDVLYHSGSILNLRQ